MVNNCNACCNRQRLDRTEQRLNNLTVQFGSVQALINLVVFNLKPLFKWFDSLGLKLNKFLKYFLNSLSLILIYKEKYLNFQI